MIQRRLRATLPGTVFKRGRRWWWRVQLPGEPEEKTRSLRPEGERYGVTSLKKAGPVALAMWQLAVEREARRLALERARLRARRRALWWARRLREVRREIEKTLARRQAAYERMIKAYRQQARSWTLRIQQARADGGKAWARRRASYERTLETYRQQAKLWTQRILEARAEVDKAVLVQKNECARRMRACKASAARAQDRAVTKIRADANRTITEQRAEFEKRIRAYKRKTTRLWDRKAHEVATEIKAKSKPRKNHFHRVAEIQKKAPRKARRMKATRVEEKIVVPPVVESTAVQQVAAEYATAQTEIRRKTEVALDQMITSVKRIAYCQCCFSNGIPEEDLTQIDSGHRMCPTCMKALVAKEAEIETLGV